MELGWAALVAETLANGWIAIEQAPEDVKLGQPFEIFLFIRPREAVNEV